MKDGDTATFTDLTGDKMDVFVDLSGSSPEIWFDTSENWKVSLMGFREAEVRRLHAWLGRFLEENYITET